MLLGKQRRAGNSEGARPELLSKKRRANNSSRDSGENGKDKGTCQAVCQEKPATELGTLQRAEELWAAQRALFFSSSRRSSRLLQRQCSLSPLFLRTRSRHVPLIGLNLMTEGPCGSSGSQSPALGRHVKTRLPKRPGLGTATANRGPEVKASSSDLRRAQCGKPCFACNGATVVRRKGVPFLGRLGTCEGGLELPRCPEHVVPGNASGLVAFSQCQKEEGT